MNITIDKAIEENRDLIDLVRNANTILAAVLGPSRSKVRGHWSPELDNGAQLVLRLQLDDGRASASADLTVDELKDPARVEGQLLRLWRDVLRERSRQQIEHLRELVSAVPEGE